MAQPSGQSDRDFMLEIRNSDGVLVARYPLYDCPVNLLPEPRFAVGKSIYTVWHEGDYVAEISLAAIHQEVSDAESGERENVGTDSGDDAGGDAATEGQFPLGGHESDAAGGVGGSDNVSASRARE